MDTDLDPPNAKPEDSQTKNPTNKKSCFQISANKRLQKKKQRDKNDKIKVERREGKRKKYTADHCKKMAPVMGNKI